MVSPWVKPLVIALASSLWLSFESHAQSSLGIGTAEPSFAPGGPFADILQWINARQQDFYRSLTGALKSMREGGRGLWLLIGLSFSYGVFHAAGPGHGKAVIASYMLANEVALKRGMALSFASSILQAMTAILVMGAVFLALRGTAISMTDATWFLETASFALVAAFGAWLLWSKARRILASARRSQPLNNLSAASAEHHHHEHGHDHRDGHHHHHAGEICPSCGHAHAPDPEKLSGEKLNWATGWSAVAAVGLRPCSGALIVLAFAFLNALWLGGILSVFAMALGTAITVSTLAVLAVVAKNWAVAIAGGGKWGSRIHDVVEIGGAAAILLLGIVLLAASLTS